MHVKIDLDDRLVHGERLREVAALFADPDVDEIAVPWYGPVTDKQFSARLWRAPVTWYGPTWEIVNGDGKRATSRLVEFKHERKQFHGRRDLEIALRWADAEPDNLQPQMVVALEAGGSSTPARTAGRWCGSTPSERFSSMISAMTSMARGCCCLTRSRSRPTRSATMRAAEEAANWLAADYPEAVPPSTLAVLACLELEKATADIERGVLPDSLRGSLLP